MEAAIIAAQRLSQHRIIMEFKRIDINKARELLDDSASNGLQIVDIRDERSFIEGHILNAAHLDNSSVQLFIAGADMSKPLLVYCYHGNMSQGAAAYFSEQGFEEAYSMDGGYSEWELNFSDKNLSD